MRYRKSSYSVYDIEYYIVFRIKYMCGILYDNIVKKHIKVIKEVCSAKYVIIDGNVSFDYTMLTLVPPHLSVSKVVQYMRGKSSRKLREELQELRKWY